MASQPKTYLTPEEYPAIERRNEYKSEYVDGEMVAMTGAGRRHNLITVNLAREISRQLRGRPCEAYASEMRVRIPLTRDYTYPDVVVVCGEPQLEDDYLDTLLNPTVLIEVLSDSTERYATEGGSSASTAPSSRSPSTSWSRRTNTGSSNTSSSRTAAGCSQTTARRKPRSSRLQFSARSG
jgi:hypothetical protein